METKLLEVRDRMTFIPVMAVRVSPINESQRYLLGRSGYGLHDQPPLILLSQLSGGNSLQTCDPYDWGGDTRTMPTAHAWITENFDRLGDGDVVDVEHILGETSEPKASERLLDPLF